MRTLLLIAALTSVSLLAGCTLNTQESTNTTPTPGGGTERSFTVTVPSGATQLRIDTTGTMQAGLPDVTVLAKDTGGSILAAHTWALKDRASDTLWVNLSGQSQVIVVAKVIDGDASLDVSVTAVVPGQPEVIVIHQTIVITQTTTVTTTPTTSTPTPSTTTPTPTVSTPTPTTTPTTNTTNSTTNNSTNVTP